MSLQYVDLSSEPMPDTMPAIMGGQGQQKGSLVSIMTIACIALVAIIVLMILYGAYDEVFEGVFWTVMSLGLAASVIMIILSGLQMTGKVNLLEKYIEAPKVVVATPPAAK